MVTVSGDCGYPAKVSQSRVNVKLEIASSVSTCNVTLLCSSWTQIICEVCICISASDDHAARNTPDVHQKFEEGYHVVRRIDRYWGELFTYLIIEQVLMRSVKTHGCLTREKGMTETQHLLWVMSMSACANMSDAMQKFTGVSYETSDQHKDISKARQARDVNDTLNLISYLAQRDPFVENPSLFNIANGMMAQGRVNVDRSREIGEDILDFMVGASVECYVFRKADQATTLGSRSTMKVKGESVTVDPQLIF